MVAAAGIEHAGDGGMAGQRVGHARGIGAVAVDAQAQRLQALDQHPGVERAERGAGVADDGLQLLEDELLGAQDRAAQGAALAVDVLGGGVHDDVGAPFERPLQHRRGEGVVEHDLGAGLVRQVAHRLDVDDVEHRVGRRFEQHGLRRLGQRLLPGLQVAAVDELALDAVLGQEIGHDVVARAEELARRDDAIAGLQQRQQREEHRRHAGRGGAAGLGAFERRQPVLEHGDGGIAEARILVVAALALEGGLGLLRARVGVARGQEQRLRRLVEVAAQLSAAHGTRLRPPRRLIGTRLLVRDRSVHCPLLASASRRRATKAPDLEGRGLLRAPPTF